MTRPSLVTGGRGGWQDRQRSAADFQDLLSRVRNIEIFVGMEVQTLQEQNAAEAASLAHQRAVDEAQRAVNEAQARLAAVTADERFYTAPTDGARTHVDEFGNVVQAPGSFPGSYTDPQGNPSVRDPNTYVDANGNVQVRGPSGQVPSSRTYVGPSGQQYKGQDPPVFLRSPA